MGLSFKRETAKEWNVDMDAVSRSPRALRALVPMIGRSPGVQEHLFQLLPEPDLHFPRGLFGKSDCADPGEWHRRSARPFIQHKVEYPVQESACLSGAGGSLNDEGPVRFLDSSAPVRAVVFGNLRLRISRFHCTGSNIPKKFAHRRIVRLAFLPLHAVFAADREIIAVLAMTGRPESPACPRKKYAAFDSIADNFQDFRQGQGSIPQLLVCEAARHDLPIFGLQMEIFTFNRLHAFKLIQDRKRSSVYNDLNPLARHERRSPFPSHGIRQRAGLVIDDARLFPVAGDVDAIDSASKIKRVPAGLQTKRRMPLAGLDLAKGLLQSRREACLPRLCSFSNTSQRSSSARNASRSISHKRSGIPAGRAFSRVSLA